MCRTWLICNSTKTSVEHYSYALDKKKIKDFSPTIQHYNSDGILMNRYIKWNFVMYMVYACNFFSQIMYKTWVQYLQCSWWGRVCGGSLSTCARLRSSPARGEAHQRVPAVVGTVSQCAPQTVWALRYRQRENSNVCNTGGPLKKNRVWLITWW